MTQPRATAVVIKNKFLSNKITFSERFVTHLQGDCIMDCRKIAMVKYNSESDL